MGEDNRANRAYKDFVNTNVFGLYRGEARLQYATFMLLEGSGSSSLKHAREQLEEAVEWFELVENPARRLQPRAEGTFAITDLQVVIEAPRPEQQPMHPDCRARMGAASCGEGSRAVRC